MSIDLSKLTSKILEPEEVQATQKFGKNASKRWLANQFIDQTTGKSIQVGQGIKIGPFEDETEAKNFLSRNISAAVDILVEEQGWGKTKTSGGHRASQTKSEIRPIPASNGDKQQYEIWIVHIKG